MSKRGKDLSDFVQNSQKKNLVFKDEPLEKKVMLMCYKDPKARDRYLAFKKSKIEDGKLKKLIQNKYDIIISDNSAQIMATLGGSDQARSSWARSSRSRASCSPSTAAPARSGPSSCCRGTASW